MIEIKHKQTGRLLLRVNADSLVGADLHGLQLGGADLRGADLQYANFSPAVSNEHFEDLILAGLLWIDHGASLSDANLYGASLQGASLVYVNLKNADLTNANLEGANVAASDLTGANLTGANLASTHFQGRVHYKDEWAIGNDLTDVVYDEHTRWPEGFDPKEHRLIRVAPGSDLRYATLDGLSLRGVNLTEVDLTSASLTGTDLSGAWLCGAILDDVDLTNTALISARYDSRTRWPADFDPVKCGAVWAS
jgi:uncharacterized protein YjbI with pentapeptide repeats